MTDAQMILCLAYCEKNDPAVLRSIWSSKRRQAAVKDAIKLLFDIAVSPFIREAVKERHLWCRSLALDHRENLVAALHRLDTLGGDPMRWSQLEMAVKEQRRKLELVSGWRRRRLTGSRANFIKGLRQMN